MDLSKEWNQIHRYLTWKSDNFFKKVIERRYSEPHREYHTLKRVNSLIRMIREYRGKDANPALFISAWFHDLVYDPTRDDNEIRSAELSFEYLNSIGVNNDLICEVDDIIFSTKARVPIQGTATIEDQQLFIDLDMAILGTRKEKYDAYSDNIMKEYLNFITEEEYITSRVYFLSNMLNKDFIYVTPEVKTRYESRAYENMQRELIALNQKLK